MNRRGLVSLSEIFILVLAIFSFSVILSGSVSATEGSSAPCDEKDCSANEKQTKDQCKNQDYVYDCTCKGNVKISANGDPDISGCVWEELRNNKDEVMDIVKKNEDYKKLNKEEKNKIDKIIDDEVKGFKEKIDNPKTFIYNQILSRMDVKTWIKKQISRIKNNNNKEEITDKKTKNILAFMKNSFIEGGNKNKFLGDLLVYLGVAVAAGIATNVIATQLGADRIQANEWMWTVGASTLIAGIALRSGGLGWGLVGGMVPLAVVALFVINKKSADIATYTCYPYVAPSGGEKCEECNNQKFPCTEYQCKSLGKTCEFIENEGDEYDICVESSRMDVEPPVIGAWQEKLSDGYSYEPLPAKSTDIGTMIYNLEESSGGCLLPYEEVDFGIALNEPGICKYSMRNYNSYEEMQDAEFFSQGVSRYNHSARLVFPGKAYMEAFDQEYNDGLNELFVRCKDARGNENKENFVFKFCVQDGPDTAPPKILGSTIGNVQKESGDYISFGVSSQNVTFYVNKPSSCKWDRVQLGYDDMANDMNCASDYQIFNSKISYPCVANLTGIQNYEENKFYILCESYPDLNASERTQMQSAKEFILKGSRPLAISSANPNGTTIKGAGSSVDIEIKVETFSGSDDGAARCEISNNNKNFIRMFETGKVIHKQKLILTPASYDYYIKCTDTAGNIATENITFTVQTDKEAPNIARVYKNDGYLRIITNEPSKCVYSVMDCSYQFDSGVSISQENPLSHYVKWASDVTLYIKCKDDFKNQNEGNDCSIVVRPYDNYQNLPE